MMAQFAAVTSMVSCTTLCERCFECSGFIGADKYATDLFVCLLSCRPLLIGLTVRRCHEPEEAIARAKDLLEQGHLRCVVMGE